MANTWRGRYRAALKAQHQSLLKRELDLRRRETRLQSQHEILMRSREEFRAELAAAVRPPDPSPTSGGGEFTQQLKEIFDATP